MHQTIQKKQRKIDFVIVNGENAHESGVGLTQTISENFFSDIYPDNKIEEWKFFDIKLIIN